MKKYFMALLVLSSVMMMNFKVEAQERFAPKCSAFGGLSGGRACAYPFVRIVLGEVADGNVITTGYIREIDGARYLFMNKDSAFARNLSEAIKIESINDEAYEAIPGMFRDRMVKVVGTYTKKSEKPESSSYATAGSIAIVSIRYFSDERSKEGAK